MTIRLRRDRVKFTCPNCGNLAYSKPSNRLVCGFCVLPMEQHLPEGYPVQKQDPEVNFFKSDPDTLPIESLALPERVRTRIEGPITAAPNKKKGSTRKPCLDPRVQAKADEIILKCLADEAAGIMPRGWKVELARRVDRDPAWVTKRIRHLQKVAS